MLKQYQDLLADVRGDGQYHSVRSLVQPDDPDVQEVADVLIQGNDFISAAQDFVSAFTIYKSEIGDYWSTPDEVLLNRSGDCDCLAILLCSILRNFIPAEDVYCAVGNLDPGKKNSGHMWVVTVDKNGKERIVEATAPSTRPITGVYAVEGLFNDKYAFATDFGLKDFDLLPVLLGTPVPFEEMATIVS